MKLAARFIDLILVIALCGCVAIAFKAAQHAGNRVVMYQNESVAARGNAESQNTDPVGVIPTIRSSERTLGETLVRRFDASVGDERGSTRDDAAPQAFTTDAVWPKSTFLASSLIGAPTWGLISLALS